MSDLTELLTSHLKREEGFRSEVYTDHLGYWTIGYGRLVDGRKGGGITENEADILLQNDISRLTYDLDTQIPWWRDLDTVRQAVLSSMAFQMGISGLLGFRKMLKAAKSGDFDTASIEMLRSRWASQTPQRALRLSHAMKTGEERDLW